MPQYQSFPGISGDSNTLDKLRALCFPDLAGKSFLDIGCNEGFFCGYALFDGAIRSVGIDRSAEFIGRARRRFPGCEFYHQAWDKLPEGQFDVILLASALHYADDQRALIESLMGALAPGGVLVLELGIAASEKNEWVKVRRGIDERIFPSRLRLADVLQQYAWKELGPSVPQAGDPVRRHVIHLQHKRPVAYLLLQPPAYGKSSITRSLFIPAGIRVLPGDRIMHQVARGELSVSRQLQQAIASDFSPVKIDLTTRRIFSSGLLQEMVELWARLGEQGDFVLDSFVPDEYQSQVIDAFAQLGYMPVHLTWEKLGMHIPSVRDVHERAVAYYGSIADEDSAGVMEGKNQLDIVGTTGFLDQVSVSDGQLSLRGWAVHESGAMPPILVVRAMGQEFIVDSYEKQLRADIKKHYGLGHAVCGYLINLSVQGLSSLQQLAGEVEIYGGNSADCLNGPFHLAENVRTQLGR